ncbi:MAG: aminopeptidase P family protein [Rikenellaceae bacterium]
MKNKRLELIRDYMSENFLSAFIVPSNDTHFGEYIQDHYKCLEWLSGFNGSAGTLVVTLEEAALWTDSRYFVQAEKQLDSSNIELKKMKMPGTESIDKWLTMRLNENSRVGVDAGLFSMAEFQSLKEQLLPLELVMSSDPFTGIWEERPAVYSNEIKYLDIKYSGETIISKHKRMIEAIDSKDNFIYLLSACDDIAWLCNIRGSDVEYNPLPLAYAAVTKDLITLFVNKSVVSAGLATILKSQGVEIEDYDNFASYISAYPKEYIRMASRDRISIKYYVASLKNGAGFVADKQRSGVIANLKSKKNNTEIEGFKKAMLLDSVSWIKLWMYLEDNIIYDNKLLTEWEVACKIQSLRAQTEDYRGESFCPIVAFGKNGALPHYEPSEKMSDTIGREGILLIDTGGQYIFGTTDTTRTFVLGQPTQEQKRDYTLVLKGMVNLSMAKFPKGTRGASLDVLARGPVCSEAKIYLHGTGHGIGHYLCVHEGPQSVRMEENPVVLEPGMVLSNEPAVYEADSYGIRIENTILCKEWTESKYGVFYQFETLTMVPIDTKPIDKELLGKEAIKWLNDYHSDVYQKLSPWLNEQEKKWLAIKTADIN